jgi:hypothetical protein
MSQSLKSNKAIAHSPSKVETILSDSVKLTLAPIVGEANTTFGLYERQAEATKAYQDNEAVLVDSFYSYLTEAKPDYPTYQAVKKHLINSIASVKNRKFDTIEKWLNSYVIKEVKALGYELPKAESKNAESMSKLRSELASIDDTSLSVQIEQLAKAGASGDKESLKRATQLASEKQKREKQAQNAIKKTESKNTTELKNALKRWVTGSNLEQLATLVWVKNNYEQVAKLARNK